MNGIYLSIYLPTYLPPYIPAYLYALSMKEIIPPMIMHTLKGLLWNMKNEESVGSIDTQYLEQLATSGSKHHSQNFCSF